MKMLWNCIFIIFFVKTISGLESELSDQIDVILKENLAKYGEQISRVKRSPSGGKTSTFYREENKVELPICQNMKGILGTTITCLLIIW